VYHYYSTVLWCFIAFTLPFKVLGQIVFEDMTQEAGLEQWGDAESLSVAWPDFNRDGLPDLWIGNHKDRFRWPSLYLNQGDGRFVDVGQDLYPENPVNDTHGSVWVDFDNDGDPDLLEIVGGYGGTGVGPNHLLVNENGSLVNRAKELGVDNPLGRGRMPLWLDYDRDGWLDLLLLHLNAERRDGEPSTNVLFKQEEGGFEDVTAMTGMTIAQQFAFLTDLTGDRVVDLASANLRQVYDVSVLPFRDVAHTLTSIGQVQDVATADFDGDSRSDIFLARTNATNDSADVVQPLPDVVAARLTSKGDTFSFKTDGALKVDFFHEINLDVSAIVVGEESVLSGVLIGEGYKPKRLPFWLSSQTPDAVGVPDCETDSTVSWLLAGFEPATRVWRWQLCADVGVNLILETEPTKTITELQTTNLESEAKALEDVLLIFDADKNIYTDKTQEAGLSQPTPCHSVTAGDFDNDMDVDLLLVCGLALKALPSLVYENNGDGTFTSYAVTDSRQSETWTSFAPEFDNKVAMADYDVDGFLDVFISSTPQTRSFAGAYLPGTPHQLLRNIGNSNHWLELDLQGTVSNRDAIGTVVYVKAGGVKQMREQIGGVHRYAQNSLRLHFGLASYSRVDEVTVYWPSGQVQTLKDIPTNQVLKIIEPETP
jgi:ASPIC and UnbV/FG-GAP-like repeat